MTGVMPEALKVPDMPKGCAYLWAYFVELKNSEAVTFTSIKAYSEIMGLDLQPGEVSTIMEFEKKYKEVF
jgi:hypothetical protein